MSSFDILATDDMKLPSHTMPYTVAMWLLLAAAPAHAQPAAGQKPLLAEDVFKNVQVLKGIPVNQFMETMGFLSASLGFNCTNCHGDASLGNWERYADDTPIKRTARRMILMVNSINQANFAGSRRVTCYTCHRGAGDAKTIPSLAEQYGTPPPEDPNEIEIVRRPPAGPAAEEILDRYVQVAGGAQRLASLTSYAAKGTYEGFDTYHAKVPLEVYVAAPEKRTVIAHTQNGDSITTFDGSTAWVAGPDRPVPVLALAPGSDWDGVKLDADLSFPARIKQALGQWRAGFPPTTIDDRDVQVIQGTTAGGTRVKLFFDKQSGLLLRQVRLGDTIVGVVPTQIDYADYRDVLGVKIPYRWTVTWTDGQSTIQLSELQPNVAVDPAKFARPSPGPAKPAVQ